MTLAERTVTGSSASISSSSQDLRRVPPRLRHRAPGLAGICVRTHAVAGAGDFFHPARTDDPGSTLVPFEAPPHHAPRPPRSALPPRPAYFRGGTSGLRLRSPGRRCRLLTATCARVHLGSLSLTQNPASTQSQTVTATWPGRYLPSAMALLWPLMNEMCSRRDQWRPVRNSDAHSQPRARSEASTFGAEPGLLCYGTCQRRASTRRGRRFSIRTKASAIWASTRNAACALHRMRAGGMREAARSARRRTADGEQRDAACRQLRLSARRPAGIGQPGAAAGPYRKLAAPAAGREQP